MPQLATLANEDITWDILGPGEPDFALKPFIAWSASTEAQLMALKFSTPTHWCPGSARTLSLNGTRIALRHYHPEQSVCHQCCWQNISLQGHHSAVSLGALMPGTRKLGLANSLDCTAAYPTINLQALKRSMSFTVIMSGLVGLAADALSASTPMEPQPEQNTKRTKQKS